MWFQSVKTSGCHAMNHLRSLFWRFFNTRRTNNASDIIQTSRLSPQQATKHTNRDLEIANVKFWPQFKIAWWLHQVILHIRSIEVTFWMVKWWWWGEGMKISQFVNTMPTDRMLYVWKSKVAHGTPIYTYFAPIHISRCASTRGTH